MYIYLILKELIFESEKRKKKKNGNVLMPRKEFVFVRAEIDRKLKLKCDLSAFLRYLN